MYQTNSTNNVNSAMQAKSVVPLPHHVGDLSTGAYNRDLLVMEQVFDHYHNALRLHPNVADMLVSRKVDPKYIDHFHLGFSDRTLGFELQSPKSLSGSQNRGHLQRLGLLKGSGHEFFRGALVIPYRNDDGHIIGAYGRRLLHQRRTPAYHLFLNAQQVSLFNATEKALPKTLILCKSAMDALTLLSAGIDNVVATMGTQGFNEHQLSRLLEDGVRRVSIAFDNTPTANHYALLVAQSLDAIGIQCYRVILPLGFDVNRFAMSQTDVAEAFLRLVERAEPFRQVYGKLVSNEENGWLKQLVTLDACTQFYLEEHRQAGKAARTLESSRYHLERFVEYCHDLGIEQVTELTASVLESYRHHLTGEKNVFTGEVISATTQKERMDAVARMLARLYYYGITEESPGGNTQPSTIQ